MPGGEKVRAMTLILARTSNHPFNVLHVYLPLSSSPSMTITYFCHGGGGGGGGSSSVDLPRLNVIMTLIFKK